MREEQVAKYKLRTPMTQHVKVMNRSSATTLRAILCVCTLGAFVPAERAAGAVPPPNPKDLTQGKWELNVAKSEFCGDAPRKATREIVDVGWDLIATTWETVHADGRQTVTRYVARYDGHKYPSTIMRPASEAITWKLVNPSRVEFVHLSKDDKVTSEYVRTVTPDGQSMTQVSKFVGRACEDIQVFDRR